MGGQWALIQARELRVSGQTFLFLSQVPGDREEAWSRALESYAGGRKAEIGRRKLLVGGEV